MQGERAAGQADLAVHRDAGTGKRKVGPETADNRSRSDGRRRGNHKRAAGGNLLAGGRRGSKNRSRKLKIGRGGQAACTGDRDALGG